MNKKLVEGTMRIASVGMAAVMATTPMVTFAEEVNTEETKPEVLQEQKEPEESKENKEEKIAEADDAIDAAKVASVEANNQMAGVESYKNENNMSITVEGEEEIDPKAAENELDALKGNVADMKEANTDADAAEDSNAQLISDASGIASTINGQMATAAEGIEDKKEELENATTTQAAQQVYDEAVEIKENADEAYEEAVKNYNSIQTQITENNQKIADAQKKYDEALAGSAENLKAAYDELEAARQVAADLQAAANTAKSNLGAEAARILAAQEERNQPENKNDWTKKQAVFMAIIQDYYIPAYKDGTLVSFVRDQKAEEKDVGKAASKDGNAHNYKVVYTDSEGEHTVYLNYKWDNQGQLVIFEKTLMDIDVYRYKNGGKYVEVNPEANNVVTIGDKKYVVLDQGTTETIIAAGTETTEDGTITTQISDTEDTYELENGQVVKVTTGTVTTITTTGKSLGGSETTYSSEAEAVQAGSNAITLAQGEELVADSVEVSTSSKTTYGVTYDGLFTATINIMDWSTMVPQWFVSEADEEKRARSNFATVIAGLIDEDEYELVGSVDTSKVKMSSRWFLNGSLTEKTYTVIDNAVITVTFRKIGMVASDVVETGTTDPATDAAKSAQASIEKASAKHFKITSRTKSNVNTQSKGTTYTYDGVSYKVETKEIDNDVEVAKVTYAQGKELEHVEKSGYYSNSNYDQYLKDGNVDHVIMLESPTSTKDLGLNDFLNKYKTDKQNYETLADKARDAAEAYATAEEKVNAIQASLDKLNEEATVNGFDAESIALQAELNVALEQAERDMEDAKEALDDITQKLAELFDQLTDKIDSLTPKNEDVPSDDGVVTTPVTEAATTPVATPVAAPVAAVPAAAIPAVAAPAAAAAPAAVTPAAGAQAVVPGAVIETPMDNTQLDNTQSETTTRTAEDLETALSDITLDEVTEANTIAGWWWLLVIAILGGTGYTLYRKHQQKKAAQTVDKTK